MGDIKASVTGTHGSIVATMPLLALLCPYIIGVTEMHTTQAAKQTTPIKCFLVKRCPNKK